MFRILGTLVLSSKHPAFPPVLSGTFVIKDAHQWRTLHNGSKRHDDRSHRLPEAFVLLLQITKKNKKTSTDQLYYYHILYMIRRCRRLLRRNMTAYSFIFVVLLYSFSWNSGDVHIITKHWVSSAEHRSLFLTWLLHPLFPSCTIWHSNWCSHFRSRKTHNVWFQLRTKFSGPKLIYFWLIGSKLAAQTRTEPVLPPDQGPVCLHGGQCWSVQTEVLLVTECFCVVV